MVRYVDIMWVFPLPEGPVMRTFWVCRPGGAEGPRKVRVRRPLKWLRRVVLRTREGESWPMKEEEESLAWRDLGEVREGGGKRRDRRYGVRVERGGKGGREVDVDGEVEVEVVEVEGTTRGREAEVEGLDGEGLAGPGPGFSNHVLSSEGATAVAADDDIEWCGGAPPSPGWVHVLPWLSV